MKRGAQLSIAACTCSSLAIEDSFLSVSIRASARHRPYSIPLLFTPVRQGRGDALHSPFPQTESAPHLLESAPPRYRWPISGLFKISMCDPFRRTCPLSSTTPLSEMLRPVRAFCSTNRIVRPLSCMALIVSTTCLNVLGSKPIDG